MTSGLHQQRKEKTALCSYINNLTNAISPASHELAKLVAMKVRCSDLNDQPTLSRKLNNKHKNNILIK